MPVIGALIAFAVACLIVYRIITQLYEAWGAWLYLTPLLLVGVFIFFLVGVPAIKKRRIYEAAPLDGPMRVEIRSEEVRAGKHRLHINVVMSQRDQEALERSGMGGHVLFDFPDPKHPDVMLQYCNITLLYRKYVDFPHIQSRDKAKEQLIEGLHALRTRLDQQREEQMLRTQGPTKESFEI